MSNPIEACLVQESGTVREAMQALERGAVQIALAVDDGRRLTGVLTDGDLRRALLHGTGLDDPVAPLITRRFVAVDARQGRDEVLEIMRARRIGAIPVVDGGGRPIGLHLLYEFLEPVERSNWAIVMAGGQGRRLRPLTEATPKPMLRVAGRPILERIVHHLVGFGIKRIYLSVNYLAPVIEDYFGDGSRFGCRIEYLREEEPLGTAGALGLLAEPPTEPIVVMNGDLVTSADIAGLLDCHAAGDFAATIGVRRYLHTVPFGCVVREDDRVVRLDEKPTLVREVNAGIYALSPDAAGLVPPGRVAMMPDVIGALLERGKRVGVFEIEDDWIDVGQREQLVRAREGD